jgi:peptide chain release factor subunit 3
MLDGYRDMGAIMAIGKVEQGTVWPGTKCLILPTGLKCSVSGVNINNEPVKFAKVGENVTLRMAGVSEDDLKKGFVLCPLTDAIPAVTKFKALVQIVELTEDRPVITAGYRSVLHAHVATEECEIVELSESCPISKMEEKEKNPMFVLEKSLLWCTILLARPTALDVFTEVQQLGRFTLRLEDKTVGIGKITELMGHGKQAM